MDSQIYVPSLRPFTKDAKLRVAHTRECRERFPRHRETANPTRIMACVTHVPWRMTGALTSGLFWSRWRGKRSRHYRRIRNPQFCVSGKSPYSSNGWMTMTLHNYRSQWDYSGQFQIVPKLEQREIVQWFQKYKFNKVWTPPVTNVIFLSMVKPTQVKWQHHYDRARLLVSTTPWNFERRRSVQPFQSYAFCKVWISHPPDHRKLFNNIPTTGLTAIVLLRYK